MLLTCFCTPGKESSRTISDRIFTSNLNSRHFHIGNFWVGSTQRHLVAALLADANQGRGLRIQGGSKRRL